MMNLVDLPRRSTFDLTLSTEGLQIDRGRDDLLIPHNSSQPLR